MEIVLAEEGDDKSGAPGLQNYSPAAHHGEQALDRLSKLKAGFAGKAHSIDHERAYDGRPSVTAVAAHPPAGERQHVNEVDIVRDISRKFEQADIAYMLTGSMAMNYYAQPRMTRDIDVVVAIAPKDVQRLIDLFRPDYYASEQSIRESLAEESIFNLIHNESVIKVDCIVRKASEYRKIEFERRQKISILDFVTFIVTKEDLIISKLSWAKDSRSELQLGDVKNLLATGYDSDYLRHWTHELKLDSLLEECLRD